MKKIKKLYLLLFFVIFLPFINVKADTIHANVDYDSEYVEEFLESKKEYLKIAHDLADYYKEQNKKYLIAVNSSKVYLYITYVDTNNDGYGLFSDYIYIRIRFSGGYNNRIWNKNDRIGYFYSKMFEIDENTSNDLETNISIIENIQIRNNPSNFEMSNIYGSSTPNRNFNIYDDSKNYSAFSPFVLYETNIDMKIAADNVNFFKPLSFNNSEELYNVDDYFKSYVEVMGRYGVSQQNEPVSNMYSINTLASITNDFISGLYENNISFYIILISLFIFNVILYLIRAIICDM